MFEEDFAGFMDDAIAAAPDREARCGMSFQALMACQAYTSGHHNTLLVDCREMLQKLQAKLSNPLLKQPAPFEF